MYIGLHVKYPLFLSDFNETEYFLQILKNNQISNFMKIRPRCSIRTGITRITAAFRNFANAPKNGKVLHLQSTQFHVGQFILNVGYTLHKHVQ